MRLQPEDRRAAILSAAIQLATDGGYLTMTRDTIAEAANVSPALINRYFFTMPNLRMQIMEEAVKREIPEIIAQGLVTSNKLALAAPGPLKLKAAMLMVKL